MKIHDIEITQEQEKAMLAVMKHAPFCSANVVEAAKDSGVPEMKPGELSWRQTPIAYRAADRMIQRERKAGRITRKRCSLLWYPVI